jgi:hypothetical protein
MSLFIETSYDSLNRFGEELCGDKVEIIRNDDSLTVVLADGLGSGVKANILSTLTSKIIGTMLTKGASIDEAVETVINTLPVCRDRGIAYSTFTILQISNNGKGYLVEFDNPSIFHFKKGKYCKIEKQYREIGGKKIKESRFDVVPDDVFVMVSDGAVHAGVGSTLNLGWQWDNIRKYLEKTYKCDISAKNISKLLVAVCDNLYAQKPGDDTTVVAVKVRKPAKVSIMVGPPAKLEQDNYVVDRFISQEGKKVVCGGTTSQIVSRELGRDLVTNLNYFSPDVPPSAEIEGIDLTTEGVLTISKALELVRKYISSESTLQDISNVNKPDAASRLAKILLLDSTTIHFFVGRALNLAHQNADFPLNMGIKLKLVGEIAECLESFGKQVLLEYY